MIQTVLDLVPPSALGPTLPHEHLLIDSSFRFVVPEQPAEKALAQAPVSQETLWWLRTNYIRSLDNLSLTDLDLAAEELLLFKREGGGCIVDVTSRGIGRNPLGLAQLAMATAMHVIMGAGYYVGQSHPPEMLLKTEDELVREMVTDIEVGVEGTNVRAGIIGELGNSWPWNSNEQKVLRAAARAQQITGSAITIHPGADPGAPLQILECLRVAGARLDQVIMGHCDRTLFSTDEQLELLSQGCYLEFDLFGRQDSFGQVNPIAAMPTDESRIELILRLISEGYLERVLISHDVWLKTMLTHFGGLGYGHILRNVVPMMRHQGLTESQVETILVENPARALTFREPSSDPVQRVET